MNLKSLRYGVQYGARMVHDLQKNTVEVEVFLWCTHAAKVYSRHTKYCAPKSQILRALLLLMWYCWLYFSCEFHMWLSLRWICQRFLIKSYLNIIQFCSIFVSFGSKYYIFFQSLDIRASKNLSNTQVFQLDLL